MVKAPIDKRIIAYLIDAAIIFAVIMGLGIGMMIVSMVVGMIVPRMAGLVGLLTIPVTFGSIGIAFLYFLLRDGLNNGASVGKKFMKLKVVKNGAKCSYVDSVLRNITLIIPIVGLIDVILGLVDKDGLRIGDKVAKTQVVLA
jgi:uncharacterized RDD family membrane protein YckC